MEDAPLCTSQFMSNRGAVAKSPQLAACAPPNQSCPHFALFEGNATIVKQLLDAQPSLITALDNANMPALYSAVEWGREEFVAMFMEHAKANDDDLKSLFFSEIRSGHDHIVGRFLEQDPHQLAVEHGHEKIVARVLVAQTGTNRAKEEIALREAVTRGRKEVVGVPSVPTDPHNDRRRGR